MTLICSALFLLGIGRHLNFMIIGSIMPLIPGVAFTNAIRDIADGDYISGSVRMLDALLVFFSIAIGVGMAVLAGQPADGRCAAMILQVLAAMVGTIAFSLLFGVPTKILSLLRPDRWSGLRRVLRGRCGLGAGGVRLGGDGRGDPFVPAGGRVGALPGDGIPDLRIFRWCREPGVYWTVYYIVTDQLYLAVQTGIRP